MSPDNKDISKRVAGVILGLIVLALVAAAIIGSLRGNAGAFPDGLF